MTTEIFNEIRATIAQLSEQLDSLERRLAELEADAEVAAQAEEPEVAEEPEMPEPEMPEPELAEVPEIPAEPVVEDVPEGKVVEIESISMDEAMPVLEDLQPEPEDDMPILEQEALSVEMIDIPMEDIPDMPVELQAPEVPVEAEVPAAPQPEAPVVEDMPELTMEEEQESLHRTTVKDRFEAAENYRWLTDIPGGHVNNIISAISLNDRVLLIGQLFKEDPMLFNTTLSALNGMANIEQVLEYVGEKFPEWDLGSSVVYRLMMAVRRKFN